MEPCVIIDPGKIINEFHVEITKESVRTDGLLDWEGKGAASIFSEELLFLVEHVLCRGKTGDSYVCQVSGELSGRAYLLGNMTG